jgi:hypothetical protein
LGEFAERVLRGSIYLALAGPREGLAAPVAASPYATERANAELRSFLFQPGQPVMHLVREIYFGVMLRLNTSLTGRAPEPAGASEAVASFEPVTDPAPIAQPSLTRERFAALAAELLHGQPATQLRALEQLAPLARARSEEGQRLRSWFHDIYNGLESAEPQSSELRRQIEVLLN